MQTYENLSNVLIQNVCFQNVCFHFEIRFCSETQLLKFQFEPSKVHLEAFSWTDVQFGIQNLNFESEIEALNFQSSISIKAWHRISELHFFVRLEIFEISCENGSGARKQVKCSVDEGTDCKRKFRISNALFARTPRSTTCSQQSWTNVQKECFSWTTRSKARRAKSVAPL